MNGLKLLKYFPTKNVLVNSHIRTYAFKSDLKIKWVRPEKIPSYKPEKSGDLQTFPEIDKTQPRDAFKNCKELEDANDLVKKIFSLEFAPRSATTTHYINVTSAKVKRHLNDFGSCETTIARWTGIIRAMQQSMERFPRNKRLKVQLKELIDKRKKYLKFLRRWDYKKFEWLLETLQLKYIPMPLDIHRVTRKDSLRKLTNVYCEETKEEKLNKLKLQLQAEQPAFLEEKIRTLQFIRDEQRDCGVEVTVSEEEIDQVKKQLEELKKENMKREEADN